MVAANADGTVTCLDDREEGWAGAAAMVTPSPNAIARAGFDLCDELRVEVVRAARVGMCSFMTWRRSARWWATSSFLGWAP
jgi:hypothetical protein